LTLACELPLLLWLARRQPLPWWRLLLAGGLASLITHPIAWRVAMRLSPSQYQAGLWWIEAAVVLAEALVYALLLRVGLRLSLAWSLAANAASFMVGWWLA